MRIFLKIIKWLAIGLVSIIAFAAVSPWFPVLIDKATAGKYEAYLQDHKLALDVSRSDWGFQFDEDFYNHKFFMLGEVHGYQRVQDLDLALLTHLNEKLGVRIYLAEINPAVAIAFNHYLKTGEDGLMLEIFQAWHDGQTSQWGNREFLAKIQKIRELNSSLPEARRVSFVGLDGPVDESFAEKITSTINNPETDIDQLNLELLRLALERQDDAGRYTHMLANIAEVQAALPEDRFYGLWGFFHIQKVSVNGVEPLAMRLNAAGQPWADQVATIATLCTGRCLNMMPSGAFPGLPTPDAGQLYTNIPLSYDKPYMFRARGVNDVKKVAGDAPLMLFDLDEDGSPYSLGNRLVGSSGYMSMLQKFDIEGGAAQASDALILIQGSDALSPLEGEAFTF